jgi:hypothetical protein
MRRVSGAAVLAVAMLIDVARAASWCGDALNPATGVTSPVSATRRHLSGSTVSARLVCRRPKSVCNGHAGKIEGTLAASPGGGGYLTGTLTYKHRFVCGVGCAVSIEGDRPSLFACSYTCPSPAIVRSGSFTIQRRCAVAGPGA